MVKYTQTIRRQQPANCLNKFDHFVGLELKGFSKVQRRIQKTFQTSMMELFAFNR